MNTNQILNKVRELLGMEVKLETMKLDDNITIIEAESFESGMEVVVVTEDEQKIPLPVGSYNLEDGRVLVVAEEGIIAEVKEKEEEPEVEVEVEVPTEEAPMEEEMSTEPAQTIKKTIESVVKETFFAEMEALKKENEELKAKLEGKVEVELSTEEEVVEPIVFNPENVQKIEGFKFASKAGNSTLNNILNKINK
jgi:DnaJ-class molecular chaperone